MDDLADECGASALAGDVRGVVGRLKRRLLMHSGVEELTGSQIAVLVRLERDGPATVTILANAEGMRPQSMGTIVAALQLAGHVEAAPDPRDGRQTILSLTEPSRAWIGAGRAARQDWLSRAILTKLTGDERAQLATGVALLARLADLRE